MCIQCKGFSVPFMLWEEVMNDVICIRPLPIAVLQARMIWLVVQVELASSY